GGGGGGGAGGGGGDNDPVPTANPKVKEAKRVERCRRCKASANKCLEQAELAETTCVQNAQTVAQWRCDIVRELHTGIPTATVWGCSIDNLLKGLCSTAEPPWNNKKLWEYSCGPDGAESSLYGKNGFESSLVQDDGDPLHKKYKCSGPGVTNCQASWAVSHPG